ncbi:MAG TPA: hypothetical protein ENN40_00035 [Candidatus Aminicenantes bacterium]|nr:hypothetical protein [Candidatus Aminicenantes bacterium]
MMKPTPIQRQSMVFFAILYVLAIIILWIRIEWLHPLNLIRFLGLVAGLILVLVFAPFLTPAFKAVLAVTRKLGSLIFALISLLVYFLILTPMAVAMRLGGKRFLCLGDRKAETWYKEWTPGESPLKQY